MNRPSTGKSGFQQPSPGAQRILFVSQRFWPLSGETEQLADVFARQLESMGHQVCVVAAGLVKQWPEKFVIGRTEVHRIPLTSRLGWPTNPVGNQRRWIRGLQKWMSYDEREFDVAIVFEYPPDKLDVTRLLSRSDLPMVVRVNFDSIISLSDALFAWKPNASDKVRFVTNSAEERQAITNLIDSRLVHLIPDGVEMPTGPIFNKQILRQSLATTHAILEVATDAPLAICTARFDQSSGSLRLIRAWRKVVLKFPLAKLWLIGSGPAQSELFQRICDLDLAASVIFPGHFDSIRDVLRAADLYIMPGKSDDFGYAAQIAISEELQIICHEKSPARTKLERSGRRHRFFSDSPVSLDQIIVTAILEPPDSPDENDSRLVVSVAEMADAYLSILNECETGINQVC